MKTFDLEGNEIEVPTLEYGPGDEEFFRVQNLDDVHLVITKVMGFDSPEQFKTETGVTAEDLVGVFFTAIGGRVYTKQ